MNEERIRQLLFECLDEAKKLEDSPDLELITNLYRQLAILAGCIIGWPGMDEEQEQERLM